MPGKKYLDDKGAAHLITKIKEMIAVLNNFMVFYSGSNKITNITNIPTDKNVVFADIKANGSLKLAGIPANGYNIHVLIKNSSNKQITISLPNTTPYILTDTDVINLPAQKIAEVNLLSNGTNIYIRTI